MPNGPTHDFITVVSAAALVPLALNADLPDNNPTNVIVLLGAYLASGLLFSPDLDLKSKPYKRWRLLRFIWLPYQNMVPHRSWISHSFFFGPLLRVLYFTGVMALLSFILLAVINALVPIDPTGIFVRTAADIRYWMEAHPWVIVYAAAGFVLGGASHTLADSIWSWVKRKFRSILRS
jgi:uncharacterized metal-binding protein